MPEKTPVKPPSRSELLTLRAMIIIGIGSMGCFLYVLLQPQNIGYAPFYWILIVAILYAFFRILHEWYHYFAISIPAEPPQTRQFTVDIFTTYFPGEPYPMVIETLKAIRKITYPHTAYLCDEANDPYLREICSELGVVHLTRNDRKDAKAGNINNALQHSTGELCVVLDPDHVPVPYFLDTIVPHFNNPEVGFVQVVQAYKNLHESLIAKGAAQQTFQFYGPMMMAMHRYGTVQAIGANCTFRRTALASIGGHAAGLSEDMHTAMRLHAKGWKSVYLPAVLSRGLVPSTLSAYYKQQLKWSRGTFELLISTYPRLFRHFTLRQRFHYGTLPFHFLCGVIFLVNFFIPILSLVMGVIPFRIDLITFFLLGFPLLVSTALIRHYVQRWVMEENERGFHVVGGLLLIGTWWVYLLGFVYTLIRKKVPYIPTPKDDASSNPWKLLLPNIIIGVLSIVAIVYGLAFDWNPYSFVMAGIAALNCLFMLFVVIAAYQHTIASWLGRFRLFRTTGVHLKNIKTTFWHARHYVYSGVRKLALPLILITVELSAFLLIHETNIQMPAAAQAVHEKSNVVNTGIFFPANTNGLTDVKQVMAYQQQYPVPFNIISLYIPWGDEKRSRFPETLVDSIYQLGAIPMITWEPWGSLFAVSQESEALQAEEKVFEHITKGVFDAYLKEFSRQIGKLKRPVYLRFAHEFDNPAYPWSPRGNNTPEEFIAAWRYVHDFFTRQGVYNAIWVWNPWKPGAVDAYFPGEAYVDWIGVDILNYGSYNTDSTWYSFEELYLPFHDKPLFQSGLPVMVAEMGSLSTEEKQDAWLTGAFDAIAERFPEIKAVVFFNSDQDTNVPLNATKDTLNWQLQNPQQIFSAKKYVLDQGETIHIMMDTLPEIFVLRSKTPQPARMPDTIRGVNFTKGQHWFKNFHTLTTRALRQDFEQMKALGINTIKRYGPTAYVRNVLSEASAYNISVHYSFWVPETLNFITDEQSLAALSQEIIETVNALKDKEVITAWNIGNGMMHQLQQQYDKPALLYHQRAYIQWVQSLVGKIKAIDPDRPVTLDVTVSNHLIKNMQLLHATLSEIDAFGLVIHDTTGLVHVEDLAVPYFFSYIPIEVYAQLPEKNAGAFIADWQDTNTKTRVTFDGILDQWGRQKPGYHTLTRQWGNSPDQTRLPPIKILRPAKPALPGTTLEYQALIHTDKQWILADTLGKAMQFEWYLVKNDKSGRSIFMKEIGKGPKIAIDIPENPATYSLYLLGIRSQSVTTHQSSLQTPLYDVHQ